MSDIKLKTNSAKLVLALATILVTAYMWLFLHAESQLAIGVLIVLALVLAIVGKKTGTTQKVEQAAAIQPGLARLWSIMGVLALVAAFYDSHFVLMMICAVLLYSTACMGLTLQFGFVGVANFAGAAFFGIGSYTTAVLATHTGLPQLANIAISGVVAAIIGSVLILPVLRCLLYTSDAADE